MSEKEVRPDTERDPQTEQEKEQLRAKAQEFLDKIERLQSEAKTKAGDPGKFEQWAVVELFGHQRIAGKVSEQVIAGQGFIRVDVPKIGDLEGYTKLYGAGAIYAITPCDEKTCRLAVANVYQPPVSEYHFRPTVPMLRDPDVTGYSDLDGDHEPD